MIWRVRRVVTGHDAAGRSTFIADGEAPNVKEIPMLPGLALTDLWETGRAPASNAGDADAAARPVRLEPPGNGSILRIVEFPPDSAWRESRDADGRAGDVLVQRGTNHSWSVRGTEPCIVAAVLVSAKPLKKAPRKKTRK